MTFFSEAEITTDPILKYLEPNPNLPEHLKVWSEATASMALRVVLDIPRSAERTAGLRKLLEAKDCFVRACL